MPAGRPPNARSAIGSCYPIHTSHCRQSWKPIDPPIQRIYGALANDEERNDLIVDDVLSALGNGRSPIVLTERKEHALHLAERLSRSALNVLVLHGGLGQKARRELANRLETIADAQERVLIATGRYVGEGFDDARLDTLFLTMPISWRGTLAQYAGRLHRIHPNKREVIVYDYVTAKFRCWPA